MEGGGGGGVEWEDFIPNPRSLPLILRDKFFPIQGPLDSPPALTLPWATRHLLLTPPPSHTHDDAPRHQTHPPCPPTLQQPPPTHTHSHTQVRQTHNQHQPSSLSPPPLPSYTHLGQGDVVVLLPLHLPPEAVHHGRQAVAGSNRLALPPPPLVAHHHAKGTRVVDLRCVGGGGGGGSEWGGAAFLFSNRVCVGGGVGKWGG